MVEEVETLNCLKVVEEVENKMEKEELLSDVIRVWVCEDCVSYEINFNCEYLYCSRCGKEMKKKRYQEFSK